MAGRHGTSRLAATRLPGSGHDPLEDLSLPPGISVEERLKICALLDVAARISRGVYIYLLLWLAIAWVSGLMQQQVGLVWGCAAWLALLAVVRHALARRMTRLVTTHPDFARHALRASVLVNGISWGLLTAASIVLPELDAIRMAMIIVAVGLCSAGSMAMAIDPVLRHAFPVVVIIPVSIAAASQPNTENLLLASLIAIYTLYVMSTIGIVHRDYWRAAYAAAELARASVTDALTQVANRMSFDREYQREWQRGRRANEGMGILMIDLDHFKKINDTHGHPAGDAVLQVAAGAIKQSLMRAGDSVARYGGEEFVVLLPHTHFSGVQKVARRILASVAAQRVATPEAELRVTCSIGCAWVSPDSEITPEVLLKQADTALYSAKGAGRNQAHYVTDDQTSFKL